MANCTIQSSTDLTATNTTYHKSLFNQAQAAARIIKYQNFLVPFK